MKELLIFVLIVALCVYGLYAIIRDLSRNIIKIWCKYKILNKGGQKDEVYQNGCGSS